MPRNPNPDSYRIAISRGRPEAPHFFFYDIDTPADTDSLRAIAPDALIYLTERGAHIVNSYSIISPLLEKLTDPKCPATATRVFPNQDYQLIQEPSMLCEKVVHIYEAVFGMDFSHCNRLMCSRQLNFGVYKRVSTVA